MAKKSRPTFQKREREKAQQQKQKDKKERRIDAKERRSSPSLRIDGEDPDIAGIRPGPQPLPEQWEYERGGVPEVVSEEPLDNSSGAASQRL
jgi:hypothetical protein